MIDTQFSGLFQLDDKNFSPTYLIGDFNGDGVEDIIAAVRLAYELDPNDKSEPPFWFKKPGPVCPRKVNCIDDSIYKHTLGYLAQFRVGRMLAVIHGNRELGWLNTQPNQRFLITDVFDKHTDRMKLFRGDLSPAPVGDDEVLPPPSSSKRDLILFLDDRNRGTAIFSEDGDYHWYPVEELPK